MVFELRRSVLRRAVIRCAGSVFLLLAATGLAPAQRNLLLVIADDVGVDRIGAYGEHPAPGRTPTIDRLAREGVLFRNCWSNPFCSATRATLMTGRYGFRTKIGRLAGPAARGLALEEWILPEVLRSGAEGAYAAGLFGKWHLAGEGQSRTHPTDSGFDRFAGTLENLRGDYDRWTRVVDGEAAACEVYATTQTVDDALGFVEECDGPWLVVLSFHAAHHPFHAPPEELHDFELAGDPDDSPGAHHRAMVQALDTELGRFLDELGPERVAATTIVFAADNGTPGPAIELPFLADHGKGSVHEGGVNVPLIVAGAGVEARGSECGALVNTTDILATLCELAGFDAQAVLPDDVVLDSRSLVPYLTAPQRPSLREFVYAEKFFPHGDGPYRLQARAIRDARYKLVTRAARGEDLFYDLLEDPFEQRDLMPELDDDQRAACDRLRREMARLVGE